jgi:hypothetical protein
LHGKLATDAVRRVHQLLLGRRKKPLALWLSLGLAAILDSGLESVTVRWSAGALSP